MNKFNYQIGGFLNLLIKVVYRHFCFSNEEFREIMSDTGIKAKTLNKLREMVVDKMKSGLTKDLEEMLRESLADGLIKRHKAVEDSPLSSEEAWFVY